MKCFEVNNFVITLRGGCFYFPFCNNFYTVNFPHGSFLVELFGASGGFTKHGRVNYPGKGGYTRGILDINHQEKLYLFVGGMGKNTTGNVHDNDGAEGGYNGGGHGSDDKKDGSCPTAGGGGATDLRLIDDFEDYEESLKQRIMVAGGGGSPGCYKTAGKGGDGGGIEGQAGDPSESNLAGGEGGKQIGSNQLFGKGERGEDGINDGEGAGSGGGGYYGGHGGKSGTNAQSAGGGGGGSSYISGLEGCIAINENGTQKSDSIHFSGKKFRNPSTLTGVNYGDGYAIITYLNWCKVQTRILKYRFKSYFIVFLVIIIQC